MSFTSYKDIIEEGDLVFVYLNRVTVKPIFVHHGEELHSRFGSFPHDSMIGKRYGYQLVTPKGKGFVYLLHPTPELWTMSLPHRTQIVYTPDSSYIMQRMNVISGSRVIEAGTGSGSFTHAFARTLGSEGKLFTYEFHPDRYNKAKVEFESHGLSDRLVITNRDVCADGFEVDGFANIDAESVFLDLPSPWDAIPHLDKVIAQNRKVTLCCFSPCVEQVVRTVEAMKEYGWTSIEMTQVAALQWESRKEMDREVDDAVKRLKDVKRRQLEGLQQLNELAAKGPKPKDWKEKNKKRRIEENESGERDRGYNPFGKGRRIPEGDPEFKWFNVSKTGSEIKTHTSYLTFASFVPQLTPVKPTEPAEPAEPAKQQQQ